MTHKALYDIYVMLINSMKKDLHELRPAEDVLWFSNGKNSIRIRLNTHKDLIFTYTNDKNWRLETVDSFLRCK